VENIKTADNSGFLFAVLKPADIFRKFIFVRLPGKERGQSYYEAPPHTVNKKIFPNRETLILLRLFKDGLYYILNFVAWIKKLN
jgi:hypothetical protein